MIVQAVQRWRDRRDSYRPIGETIDTRCYEVESFSQDTIARAFVEQHHYSATYPAARHRFGLYRGGALVGVAVFSQPCNNRVLAIFPGDHTASIELGRFVLLDDVPANGESWFLARCFERLRAEGLVGVVSFSDPIARTTSSGRLVFPGHVGTIYQAHNATYLGLATPRSLRLLPDGTVYSERARSKVRKQERGRRYSEELLVRHGAPARLETEDPAAWLKRCLPTITRPLRHPGNHKYAWMLNRRDRKHLPTSEKYPKIDARAT